MPFEMSDAAHPPRPPSVTGLYACLPSIQCRADEKSTHPSVEVEQAEQHEQRVSALRECLQKLPERSRRLVQQRYFEQLSLGVIAADEETNANNVSQILFRLRSALSDCIQKQLGNIGT